MSDFFIGAKLQINSKKTLNLVKYVAQMKQKLYICTNKYKNTVCEFIGFLPSQVKRDIRLFKGRTRQYVYISSASAYNKPARSHIITEGTTLANPYWQYSRDKIACEELLMKEYRDRLHQTKTRSTWFSGNHAF